LSNTYLCGFVEDDVCTLQSPSPRSNVTNVALQELHAIGQILGSLDVTTMYLRY
jgi:hypothetical protein